MALKMSATALYRISLPSSATTPPRPCPQDTRRPHLTYLFVVLVAIVWSAFGTRANINAKSKLKKLMCASARCCFCLNCELKPNRKIDQDLPKFREPSP